jgi:predicted AlkP superfamily pyrophosphatase or phosphodiesterase
VAVDSDIQPTTIKEYTCAAYSRSRQQSAIFSAETMNNLSRRNSLSIARCLIALAAVLIFSAKENLTTRAATTDTPAATNSDRIVVLISVDGLCGYYLDDPQAEMPTIRQIAAEGVRASAMKASNPTVTWTNHVTLVTGVNPARHGVIGNNYFDRNAGKTVTLLWDPNFDKDEIVKVPTIYDIAKMAGLKTAAIRWPATRNAHAVDWNSPDLGKDELVKKYTTPSLYDECKQAGYKIDGDGGDRDEGVKRRNKISEDPMWTDVFNMVLREHRPNLALFHIVNVDHVEHLSGPKSPEAYAAIKTADDQVRQVWDELKKEFPGKATLLIVSDHGFSQIDHSVLPNVVLRQAGLVDATGDRITGGSVHVVVQGGAALVYVDDAAADRERTLDQVKKAFAGHDGVERIVDAVDFKSFGLPDRNADPHAPDLILFSKEGYNFGDTAAGDVTFVDKPERKGSHGHNADLPDLHAMFVAWGAGMQHGAPIGEIENTSVAPTIAKLLNFSMTDVDSQPLTAALAPAKN